MDTINTPPLATSTTFAPSTPSASSASTPATVSTPIDRIDISYRRALTPKTYSWVNGGKHCIKCRGWGGILVQVPAHARSTNREFLRWTKRRCDACQYPKFSSRFYPKVGDSEVIYVGDRSQAQEQAGHKCDTCLEVKSIDQIPVLITVSCNHESATCFDCLHQYIVSQLDDGKAEIACPAAECPAHFEGEDVHRAASNETYQRFLQLAFRKSLAADRTFKYCMNPTCQSGQELEHWYTEFNCDACESKFCLKHEPMANHGDESCADYDVRMEAKATQELKVAHEEEERSTERILNTCPGCNVRIWKWIGCDHVTCSQCRFEFCWTCGADYNAIRNEGNTAHKADCRYHSTNLNPMFHYLRPEQVQNENAPPPGGIGQQAQ